MGVTALIAGALWLAATGTSFAAAGGGYGGAPFDLGPKQERIYRIELRLARAQAQTAEARRAIAAAESQIGVPYVYASARPGHGFDCSGLVMWAWGRAGVRLPHNSTDQYLALPHVSRAGLRPGDVLYFVEPQDHVAIYLGGDLMIHAPGRGQSVRIERIYWRYFVGAGRPSVPMAPQL